LAFLAFFKIVSRDSHTFSVFEHVKLEHVLVFGGPWETFAEHGSAIELWVSFGSGVRSGVDLWGVDLRGVDLRGFYDRGLLLVLDRRSVLLVIFGSYWGGYWSGM